VPTRPSSAVPQVKAAREDPGEVPWQPPRAAGSISGQAGVSGYSARAASLASAFGVASFRAQHPPVRAAACRGIRTRRHGRAGPRPRSRDRQAGRTARPPPPIITARTSRQTRAARECRLGTWIRQSCSRSSSRPLGGYVRTRAGGLVTQCQRIGSDAGPPFSATRG